MSKYTKLDRIKKDIDRRLSDWERQVDALEQYPVIKVIMEMPNQACYSLFHIGNETLGAVEELRSMLVNGLYDDANIAFVKRGDGYYITRSQDDPKAIFEEELLEIVEAVKAPYEYYEDNSAAIEAWDINVGFKDKLHPHNIWWAMSKFEKEVKRKYGWDDSDAVKDIQARWKIRKEVIKTKLEEGNK